MNGYVIEKDTRKIIHVVENVIAASDTDMTGGDTELRGIDTALASVVVSDTVHEVGETLPESVTDDRAQLPKTPKQEREAQVASLEAESVDTMLALTEVYETTAQHDTTRERENVDTMLALTEAYEMILQLQATNDALTARIVALEGGVS